MKELRCWKNSVIATCVARFFVRRTHWLIDWMSNWLWLSWPSKTDLTFCYFFTFCNYLDSVQLSCQYATVWTICNFLDSLKMLWQSVNIWIYQGLCRIARCPSGVSYIDFFFIKRANTWIWNKKTSKVGMFWKKSIKQTHPNNIDRPSVAVVVV